jgi:hypothetical protein
MPTENSPTVGIQVADLEGKSDESRSRRRLRDALHSEHAFRWSGSCFRSRPLRRPVCTSRHPPNEEPQTRDERTRRPRVRHQHLITAPPSGAHGHWERFAVGECPLTRRRRIKRVRVPRTARTARLLARAGENGAMSRNAVCLAITALIGVWIAGCLITVPVPFWDGGHHHHHHGRDR